MKKVDFRDINANNISDNIEDNNKLYLLIIEKDTYKEEKYIIKNVIYKYDWNDYEADVVYDANHPDNPFKKMIIKSIDDIYELSDKEKYKLML